MTSTYAIDNSKRYKVTVADPGGCSRVEVRENYTSSNPPTTDLIQYQPAGASQGVYVVKGTSSIFSRTGKFYLYGEVVGEIQTASGSITVAQIEGGQV